MTDCWRGTQLKWNSFWNPGPFFHFLEGPSGVVEANSDLARDLVKRAENDMELGIALHTFQDTYSHAGFVGRWDKINQMGLTRRWLPKYGHTQMLQIPDRTECQWTDSRTGDDIKNCIRFEDALLATYELLLPTPGFGGDRIGDILAVLLDKNYDNRKNRWAKIAGMSNIRFSKITDAMWAEHGPAFKQAAHDQYTYIKAVS